MKEPWQRSSHWNALGQMLTTNSRLDKLAAARVDFASRGMLEGTLLQSVLSQLGKLYSVLNAGSYSDISGTARYIIW